MRYYKTLKSYTHLATYYFATDGLIDGRKVGVSICVHVQGMYTIDEKHLCYQEYEEITAAEFMKVYDAALKSIAGLLRLPAGV